MLIPHNSELMNWDPENLDSYWSCFSSVCSTLIQPSDNSKRYSQVRDKKIVNKNTGREDESL